MLRFSSRTGELLPVGNLFLTSGKFLMYLASADAVLRDYDDNVIHYTPLPIRFHMKGKVKSPANPRNAQRRAVRGVSAQQRREDYTMHPDNPLASDIYTYMSLQASLLWSLALLDITDKPVIQCSIISHLRPQAMAVNNPPW